MRRRQEEIRWEAAWALSSVEDIPSIVASELYGKGAPLGRLLREWSVGDHGFVSISARPYEHRADCSVRLEFGHDQLRFSRKLEVSWTRVGQVSRRAWIHCSVGGCDRKVRRLFIVPNHLACRQCAGLRYVSKNRLAHERSRVRADKLRARLGAQLGFDAPFPSEKPKGMHWSTFDRLRGELSEEERRFWDFYHPVLMGQLKALERRQHALEAKAATVRLSGSSSVAGPSVDSAPFQQALDDLEFDLSEEPDRRALLKGIVRDLVARRQEAKGEDPAI